ncbi:hypothetical protein J3R30DRAFT_3400637 [Lentinula aciculospora]|uniref:Protein N-terminal glutamine amidohydrolase n=1 Tax=Lentinula aciculospora TaxID=153920 RepID=A0A9W9DWA3_9AGAR|nr:hypothetical protein J3R30DRAFT_3400637 [Lentinula aciculospora]
MLLPSYALENSPLVLKVGCMTLIHGLGYLYLGTSFSTANVPDQFESFFRVVSANVYLDRFASDRSHMFAAPPVSAMLPIPTYLQPAPPYPPLRGAHCMSNHNLMDFVSMLPSGGYGDVFNIQTISGFFELKEELEPSEKP